MEDWLNGKAAVSKAVARINTRWGFESLVLRHAPR